jgi:hypothetical protein
LVCSIWALMSSRSTRLAFFLLAWSCMWPCVFVKGLYGKEGEEVGSEPEDPDPDREEEEEEEEEKAMRLIVRHLLVAGLCKRRWSTGGILRRNMLGVIAYILCTVRKRKEK